MNLAKNSLKPEKELKLRTFLVALLTAACVFVPFMIYNGGYFLFFGDFNVQQIPFYMHCHELIRSGNIGWDFGTDLGANFIASYSFYLLGSPFFLFTLLFPNFIVPYLMGPLYIIKFALAALTAYLFIRRFTARPQSAMLGGLLYAFSGFSVYNVFYNHFHEAIIFFPLLLLCLELFMTENKKGYLALSVFICAFSNYFFFYGMVVFVVIYWLVRTYTKSYKVTLSKCLLLAFECILGLLMSAVLLLPSAFVILQNGRTSEFMTGWSAVLYGKEQIFLNVIQCFFFPPDLPARAVFFPEAKVQWSSLGGWLPLFSMTGVICFLSSAKKGHWLRRVLFIMIFMALVPGLNCAFYMFNTAYYARWFYMPILLMCLATAMSIEDLSVDWDSAYRWTLGITLAFTAVIGLFPNGMEDGKIKSFGLYTKAQTNPFKFIYQSVVHLFDKSKEVTPFDTYDIRFWITCLLAIGSLVLLRFTFNYLKAHKKQFFNIAIPLVCAVSIIYSVFFIGCGKTHSYDDQKIMIDSLIEGEVTLPDSDKVRVDVCEGVDNTGMYLGFNTINCFHSIVPSSVTEFYEFVGVERGVATRPEIESEALRSFLSVKYMLDPQIDGKPQFLENGKPRLEGYSYFDTINGYAVYQNDNYLGYGFSFDFYITEEEISNMPKTRVDEMLLKGIILTDEQIKKYSDHIKPLSDYYNVEGYDPTKLSFSYTPEDLSRDVAELSFTSAKDFTKTRSGFTCKVEREKSNLVLFTIPYEEGWTAFVNGKQVDIEKVDVGFMAVLVDDGTSEIEFVYKTPYLEEGLIITGFSFLAFIFYFVAVNIFKKGRNLAEDIYENYPEREILDASHKAYLEAGEEDDTEDILSLLEGKSDNTAEIYGGFEGGFSVNENILEENESDGE